MEYSGGVCPSPKGRGRSRLGARPNPLYIVVGVECRHDMRLSVKLPSASGVDGTLHCKSSHKLWLRETCVIFLRFSSTGVHALWHSERTISTISLHLPCWTFVPISVFYICLFIRMRWAKLTESFPAINVEEIERNIHSF